MNEIVRMSHISRVFEPDVQALADANLTIREGESVAITGPSGSGKSTLLALLGLLDSPTSGEYRLCGVDTVVQDRKARERLRRETIGFIFQAFHLIEHMTIEENVLYALSIHGIHGDQSHQLARRTLKETGILHRAHEYPSRLSGGERQRTAIARAVACRPKLLLCDEPTGNLDSRNAFRIIELLQAAVTDAGALVIVTHDETVAASCNRRLAMRDGRIMT